MDSSSAIPEKNWRQLPTHYNPQKGLIEIAAAESWENYYRRAKDVMGLFKAVEDKLTEQRWFILWWDQQEKHKGAARKRRIGPDTALKRSDLPIDANSLQRWRDRLKPEDKFEKTLATVQERCRRSCEAEKGATEQKGASGGREIVEWYTPPEFIPMVRDVLGNIDLDPASSNGAQQIIQADRFYTAEDDGLSKPWNGRIWLNPPYTQPLIAEFISKLIREISLGNTESAILLTHNYTDTAWFHEAVSLCTAICFTRGRIRFISNDGTLAAPTQGQAFFYYGLDFMKFAERFKKIGFVVAEL